MKFTAITIIYNPVSTGPSKRLAFELRHTLQQLMPDDKARISAVPTEHASHAEELAYDLARATAQPLIIASGGDGSYHEIVNGVMRAAETGATAACGLLPGGNANDHYRALHAGPLEEHIVRGRGRHIDLLQVEITHDGKTTRRYAHSYCGFGLTAEAGLELNGAQLNRAKESWLVIRSLGRLRAVKVLIRGQQRSYTSLICSNIGRMSKVLKLSADAKPHDGSFELTTVRGSGKLRLIRNLLLATTTGFPEVKSKKHFSFTATRHMRLQLDGEIYALKGGTTVTITVAGRALRCFV